MWFHVCRVELDTGLLWCTGYRWDRCLWYRRCWNWAPIHIPELWYRSCCHSGVLPHSNSLESGFQYNWWAPISVIPMMNSSFSPSTMRTVALTSFPAMYIFMQYLPNTIMAPLVVLPKAECVSSSLIGRFFSRIFLKALVLIQLTSASVSYRALTVNKFSILQLINGLECKEFILN